MLKRKQFPVLLILINMMFITLGFAQEKDSVEVNPFGTELTSKRTLKSKTYLDSKQNQLTTVISSGFVHYKDKHGKYREIKRGASVNKDSTGFVMSDGLYQANISMNLTTTDWPIQFITNDSTAFYAKPLYLGYYNHAKKQVQILQKVQSISGDKQGRDVLYENAFDAIDIQYQLLDTRIKQNIRLPQIVRDKLPPPESFGWKSKQTDVIVCTAFDVSDGLNAFADDVNIQVKKNGKNKKDEYKHEGKERINFKNQKGEMQFFLPMDVAYVEVDSQLAVLDNIDPKKLKTKNKDMWRQFYTENDTNFIVTGVDYDWIMEQPEGTIVLDPTVALELNTSDTYIINGAPDSNYGTYLYTYVGGTNSLVKYRTLLKFDLTGIPDDAQILNSELQVYCNFVSQATPAHVYCHALKRHWVETSATWNRRTSVLWITPGVDLTQGIDAEIEEEDYITITDDLGWKYFSITNLAREWIDKTRENFGVILYAGNELEMPGWKRFVSSNDSSFPDRHPRLVITHAIEPLVTYEYDAQSRPVKTIYAGGYEETNTYDSDRDWLKTKTFEQGIAELLKIDNADYDAVGNLERQVVSSDGASTKTYEYLYDNLHRLTDFIYNGTLTRKYDYDGNGNRINSSCANSSYTYTYNSPNNRLHHFQVTENSVTTTKNYIFDDAGRVEDINGIDLTYDLFSNMLSYDTDVYKYDSEGQRIKKTAFGETTFYFGIGGQTYSEFESSTTAPNAEYIYGVGGMVAKYNPKQGYKWFFKDHLGSTRGMGNPEDPNTMHMKRDYYPYGQDMFVTSGSGETTDYLFTGKELDGESELYYFGKRYYDPSIGRWIVPDPMDQYWSPYVYCGNNPLRYIDPTGMEGEETEEEKKKKEEEEKKQKVAIDPGHGDQPTGASGIDPGTVKSGVNEKDVVLKISNATIEKLKKEGYEIVQTRTGDIKNPGVKLEWRLKKAKGSDVLVSIHVNSNPKTSARGFEVFHNTKGKSLAKSISNSVSVFPDNRGIKSANFRVLRKFSGPSVLVEAGFLSNPKDRAIITTKHQEIGKQIGTGIINYLEKK